MGPLLVIIAVSMMWWNEGHAVYTAQSLDEGANRVVSLEELADLPVRERNGALVHFTGRVQGKTLSDDEFGVAVDDAISLKRKVSMYQWKEREHKQRRQEGQREVTYSTYTYHPEWSTQVHDQNRFREPEQAYPENPSSMAVTGNTIEERDVEVSSGVGNLLLSHGLRGQITGAEGVRVKNVELPSASQLGLSADYTLQLKGSEISISSDDPQKKIAGGASQRNIDRGYDEFDDGYGDGYDDGYDEEYDRRGNKGGRRNGNNRRRDGGRRREKGRNGVRRGGANRDRDRQVNKNGKGPAIGDMKVSYEAVYARDVSIIARLERDELVPYVATNGYDVEMLSNGRVGPMRMFEQAHNSNNFRTWLLRGVGFVMTFMGMRMAISFVDTLAGGVPLFGSLLGGLVGLALNVVVFFAAVSVTFIVVGLAWVYYRPFIGITMVVGGAAMAFFSYSKLKKNQQVNDENGGYQPPAAAGDGVRMGGGNGNPPPYAEQPPRNGAGNGVPYRRS